MKQGQEKILSDWQERENLAEKMVPLVGKIFREKSILPLMYGRTLLRQSPTEILRAHRWVRRVKQTELSILDSFPLMEVMAYMDLAPAKIDLGKLTYAWLREGKAHGPKTFLEEKLKDILNKPFEKKSQDVVLYGFGRIGRLLARILIERSGSEHGLVLRAVVVRPGSGSLEKRASLLRRDSVHGRFKGTIQVSDDETGLIVNGVFVQFIEANAPDSIDYASHGIKDAIVIDNTGKWRDEEGLSLHLKSGAAKVMLTAPGKGDVKNVVFGVNHTDVTKDDKILSAASCTTNAISPVLKVVNDEYGIVAGHIETVHSYTNDQNLIDNFHPKERRGRAAALNMVITETGAAKAVAKCLPELAGKLTGNAIRVPTPNVSLAILNLTLEKSVDKDKLNDVIRDAALYSPLRNQIDFTASSEVVSSDLVGSRFASIVDSKATLADGNRCVLYVWYDNEFGYSYQVIRFAEYACGVAAPHIP